MPQKRQEKIRSAAELEKIATEIAVTNRRSAEPFIKVFNYSGENISVSQLGTLAGVFEIADKSEESAYIVNFLASVAKKEYFINPRRGAVESFEAALHKINLALSMLVKHGNTAWLGKLNGAIGVVEKNNIHFSVTGEAKILLLRNNHFSDISADLASEESSLHPIKTFVEISSGRLLPGDKIIITSPELLALLSLDNLKKNASRMDNERFAQFLHTALVNELDIAGTILIDIYEGQPVPIKKQEIKRDETVSNVFSEQAFVPHIKIKENKEEESEKKIGIPRLEYIDSKTGHIYVQGDAPSETSPYHQIERARFLIQETGNRINRFFSNRRKIFRKTKKQGSVILVSATQQSSVIIRKTFYLLQKQLKNIPSLTRPEMPSVPISIKPKFFSKENIKLNFLRKWLSFEMPNFFRRLLFFWNGLSLKRQKIISAGSILTIIIIAASAFFLTRQTNENSIDANKETPQEQTEAQIPTFLDTEKNARLLQEPITLATAENNILSSIVLNDETYLITAKEIINVSEEKRYALPQDGGSALLAAPMNDLSLIFIYTDAQKLFAWSTINHTFVQNTILLPEKTIVRDIGTYLTYLYVLDDTNDQVYRFPRAEGGFGQPTSWLKDSIALEENAQMAVSENIFLATGNNSVQMFFRGRYVKNLESPNTPLAVTSLFTRPDLAHIYALDKENKRVVVWNQDSTLTAQYFSEKLSEAKTININEKTNEILITTDNSLLAFKIEQ
jgi:hypothetical protein